jgi:hypothetical protein
LKRPAAAAGHDVSEYVLARALPPTDRRLGELLTRVASAESRYALAELNDFLTACPPIGFRDAVAHAKLTPLSRYLQNYVAAMVEQAATAKGTAPPPWTADIAPLDTSHFATELASLRLHLLRSAPVPFKRRNIFVDSTIGARA